MGDHIVLAPDKFKGSLTARQAARAMKHGVRRADPTVRAITCPVADGGEGTLDAVVAAGFDRIPAQATGPTGAPVNTGYARLGSRAIIEMADACGLQRLPSGKPAPMTATSYGLGCVVAQALDDGCRDIVITLGGSASTDGGAGMLIALGAEVLDHQGESVGPGGRGLAEAARLDLTKMHPAITESVFTLAADVDNPLCGPHGAAILYGPQKGAHGGQVAELEGALAKWADLVDRVTDTDCRGAPGAGAAGGVGFAASAVLGARVRPGIEMILDIVGLDRALLNAKMVLTGEGCLDVQSLRGKAPVGVSRRARRHGVPTFAVAGVAKLTGSQARAAGFVAVRALNEVEPDQRRCITNAADLLSLVTERLIRESTPARGRRPPRS
ncbi:glycerate kinase [Mycobacterium kubicae]|uniref:Glycerate kinase n=1 Tax=Mycobacterium kubicae TaxID=120959 RepID=A0AAX1JDE5_9MYCO|nr:glycerate kinase [Mycobacterium kubicae]MCV7098559.1 glycerate kinase [Mycobacterium kubicae]ORV95836.1 glycerate kinase [Mycobacterium kubicae]QNI11027.1 glycerate kinase [Mycobacterium kubicae]QPI39241.1 glycerate kinase [Mycobacterium kubicae]GFG63783.1 glycerate kinase [Mycobacterium kubicae]